MRPEGPAAAPASGRVWRSLSRDAGMGEAGTGATIGELALLQRQHSLLQEELGRLRGADGRLKDSEKVRAQLERQVRDMKAHGSAANPDASPTTSSQQVGEHCSQVRTRLRYFYFKRLASAAL